MLTKFSSARNGIIDPRLQLLLLLMMLFLLLLLLLFVLVRLLLTSEGTTGGKEAVGVKFSSARNRIIDPWVLEVVASDPVILQDLSDM